MVEVVIQFKYIGRTLERTENDWPPEYWNIGNGRAAWRRLVKMLK